MVISQQLQVAESSDFELIKKLIDQANQYALDRSGYKLWTNMDYAYSAVGSQIMAGEFYILKDKAGDLIATIVISQKNKLWPSVSNDSAALYVSKLMKNPLIAETGIGLKLLGFAASKALAQGKNCLRCDTVSELTGLVNYYLGLGFKNKGQFIYDFSNRPGIFLQADALMILHLAEQSN